MAGKLQAILNDIRSGTCFMAGFPEAIGILVKMVYSRRVCYYKR